MPPVWISLRRVGDTPSARQAPSDPDSGYRYTARTPARRRIVAMQVRRFPENPIIRPTGIAITELLEA